MCVLGEGEVGTPSVAGELGAREGEGADESSGDTEEECFGDIPECMTHRGSSPDLGIYLLGGLGACTHFSG